MRNVATTISLAIACTLALLPVVNSSAQTPAHLLYRGDDNGWLYLNGTLLSNATTPVPLDTTVTVPQGHNYLVTKVTNNLFDGGTICALMTATDTIVTDTTWRVSVKVRNVLPWETPDYITAGFDDSQWPNAGDLGPVDGANIWWQALQTEMQPFVGTGAHWIWTPDTLYFRKVFASPDSGPAAMRIWADGPCNVWLNGVYLGPDTVNFQVVGPPAIPPMAIRTYDCTVHSGDNLIAVQGITPKGKTGGMDFALDVVRNGAVVTITDATWLASGIHCTDWQNMSFIDSAASWGTAGVIFTFDAPPHGYHGSPNPVLPNISNPAATPNYIWAKTVYARKDFTIGPVSVRPVTASTVQRLGLAGGQSRMYGIDGRVLTAGSRRKATGVTLRRSQTGDVQRVMVR
jgi:hypothetical protein